MRGQRRRRETTEIWGIFGPRRTSTNSRRRRSGCECVGPRVRDGVRRAAAARRGGPLPRPPNRTLLPPEAADASPKTSTRTVIPERFLPSNAPQGPHSNRCRSPVPKQKTELDPEDPAPLGTQSRRFPSPALGKRVGFRSTRHVGCGTELQSAHRSTKTIDHSFPVAASAGNFIFWMRGMGP